MVTLAIAIESIAKTNQYYQLVRKLMRIKALSFFMVLYKVVPNFLIAKCLLHKMFLNYLGLSDAAGESMVKLYCPKCMDVYTPKSSRHHHTDGSYFGTGFPHMLFMVHPECRPKRSPNQFVPR